MALKTNFEDANFISSPFVDEVANPGNLSSQQQATIERTTAQAERAIAATELASKKESGPITTAIRKKVLPTKFEQERSAAAKKAAADKPVDTDKAQQEAKVIRTRAKGINELIKDVTK